MQATLAGQDASSSGKKCDQLHPKMQLEISSTFPNLLVHHNRPHLFDPELVVLHIRFSSTSPHQCPEASMFGLPARAASLGLLRARGSHLRPHIPGDNVQTHSETLDSPHSYSWSESYAALQCTAHGQPCSATRQGCRSLHGLGHCTRAK